MFAYLIGGNQLLASVSLMMSEAEQPSIPLAAFRISCLPAEDDPMPPCQDAKHLGGTWEEQPSEKQAVRTQGSSSTKSQQPLLCLELNGPNSSPTFTQASGQYALLFLNAYVPFQLF